MLLALLLFDGPTPEQLGLLIPIAAIIMSLGIVIVVSIAIAWTKVKQKECERDTIARRLAYEQRMKELEVEAMRLRVTEEARR